MMAHSVDILQACEEPKLFKSWFKNPSTWRAWFAFMSVLFGLPMDDEGWALFRACTGRDDRPASAFKEAWLVVGRRGGKSIVLALIAVYISTFIDWTPYLSPGERGTVMVIASDRRQARTIFRYVRAFLGRVPMLAALIERETADEIDLDNGVTIEITAASYRTVRGYTLIAALLDELAFWPNDEGSRNPDARDPGRDPACHGVCPQRNAAVRQLALRQARRSVERVQAPFWQAQLRAGLEGGHAHHEFDDPASGDRRGYGR